MPHLAHIFIYPIKSLDGVEVFQAKVLETGALEGDREFALVDADGNFVNGKRNAAIHRIRAGFDLADRTVSLWVEGTTTPTTFHLEGDRPALEQWFSDYFGFSIKLVQNREMGFPDDTVSPGPTIISTATLDAIAHWFPGFTLQDSRRRFRTNLEISDVEPFWEECLYQETDQPLPFQIGPVQLHGINPCQRCIVPTRNPITGEAYPAFQKTFTRKRQETLPAWAARSRFNHFYRLAVNTRLSSAQAGKVLQLGDRVSRGAKAPSL